MKKIILKSLLLAGIFFGGHAFGATWTTEIVDSTGKVGLYTSMAFDSANNSHVSYYDSTNQDLKYATNMSRSTSSTSSTIWTIETVDSAGSVGLYSSIGVANADYSSAEIRISYYDNTNKDLKFSDNESAGSWTAETVDSVGSVGSYSSLKLDSSGITHISYYDTTNKNLKYATDGSATSSTTTSSTIWTTETADSTGSVGLYSSIGINASNGIQISYYDTTNLDLKFATQ